MTQSIDVFPDTNLFVQCRALEQLDWTIFSAFDEVRLLVARPVQAEVDAQKGGGSGRLAKRAREVSSRFRKVLEDARGFQQIRAEKPSVRLYLRPDLKPHSGLSELDYQHNDDRLVGIAAQFAADNPGAVVKVLTHDTGPMFSAKTVGLPFQAIPDDWLLEPESTAVEKQQRALEAEVARYRNAEPVVEFEYQFSSGTDGAFDLPEYLPLGRVEVDSLVQQLRTRIPAATDFGEREEQERWVGDPALKRMGLGKEIFVPASDEAIARYRDEAYPAWLEACATYLEQVHATLLERRAMPSVTVVLKNTGSRPANDTLVTISAQGNFSIAPPSWVDDDEPPNEAPPLELPRPPAVPRGHWRPARTYDTGFPGRFAHMVRTPMHLPNLSALGRPRDPNAFFWKPSRPDFPRPAFHFECQQWRHGTSNTTEVCIHVDLAGGEAMSGALQVEVQAANLTQPAVSYQKLRVRVVETSAQAIATDLVQRLVDDYSSGA